MSVISPNMNLVISTINVDSGLAWETNLNASLSIIDQHDHTSGNGVQIQPAGLNINSSLSFQNNQAIDLQAAVFTPQTSLATLDALYVKGVDLYFNDGSSNVVRLTSGGLVNATSSGISSGTASASFVSSVLVVNAASTTPADIQGGSIFIGNNVANSKFLKLSPPNAMASDFTLVLPDIPPAQYFMSLDASGNMAGYVPVAGGISSGNIAAGGINGSNIAAGTISGSNLANGTISGTQIQTNVNLNGTAIQAGGKNVVISNTNNTKSLSIIRGSVDSAGNPVAGADVGFTITKGGTGIYTVVYSSAFSLPPSFVAVGRALTGTPIYVVVDQLAYSTSAQTLFTYNASNAFADEAFDFIAIGQS